MSTELLDVFLFFFFGVLPSRPPYNDALAKSDSARGGKVSGYMPVSVCIRQRPTEREKKKRERERERDR
jgi:hypothetical protein